MVALWRVHARARRPLPQRARGRDRYRAGRMAVTQDGDMVQVGETRLRVIGLIDAVIIAVGLNSDGRREVLGMAIGHSEAAAFWTGVLRSLPCQKDTAARWTLDFAEARSTVDGRPQLDIAIRAFGNRARSRPTAVSALSARARSRAMTGHAERRDGQRQHAVGSMGRHRITAASPTNADYADGARSAYPPARAARAADAPERTARPGSPSQGLRPREYVFTHQVVQMSLFIRTSASKRPQPTSPPPAWPSTCIA